MLIRLSSRKITGWFSSARSVAAIFGTSVLFATLSLALPVPYTKAMFVDGLNKGGFVLITVRDPKGGLERPVATLEAGLLGAIHLQQHIDYDENGRQRAEEIALKRWNQPFRFTNREAFNTVKPSYTTSQLDEIRNKLSKYDRVALQKELDDPDGAIHRLYAHPYRESYRDAVAHVLLENGVLVGIDDRTPMLRPLDK